MQGFRCNFKPLKILTEQQIESIHQGTLEVLERTGLRIEYQRALKLLEKNGCRVDHDNNRVRFPPALVEESLRKCPSSFRIKARDPDKDLVLGGNTVYFLPFPGKNAVDPGTWEIRPATRREFYDAVTILDGLDNLHGMYNFAPYPGFAGVPEVEINYPYWQVTKDCRDHFSRHTI